MTPSPFRYRYDSGDVVAIALAGDAPTEERMSRGVEVVRAGVARDRNRIAQAELCARRVIADLQDPLTEAAFVDLVCEKAGVGEYLASYVIDKLRGQGSLQKDWSTGLLSQP